MCGSQGWLEDQEHKFKNILESHTPCSRSPREVSQSRGSCLGSSEVRVSGPRRFVFSVHGGSCFESTEVRVSGPRRFVFRVLGGSCFGSTEVRVSSPRRFVFSVLGGSCLGSSEVRVSGPRRFVFSVLGGSCLGNIWNFFHDIEYVTLKRGLFFLFHNVMW